MKSKIYSFLEGKNIILYGVGHFGRSMLQKLEFNGFPVTGFIDQNIENLKRDAAIAGRPIYAPDQFNEIKKNHLNPVIIATAYHSQDQIATICEHEGFAEGDNFFRLSNLSPNMYAVDISGACNLKCPLCPCGKGRGKRPPAGFMSAETFSRVADKIIAEDPFAPGVLVYAWGEPLLNKELPQIIAASRERGLPVNISSNLNVDVDLGPIIKAGPSWFRVSLSGFGPRYEVTHGGGRFPVLYKKLNDLSDAVKKHRSDVKVQVIYHLYKDNRGDDLRKAREFCASKGFEFETIWAFLLAFNELAAYAETGCLPDEAKRAAELMEFDLDAALRQAKSEARKSCTIIDLLLINWDLTVANCAMHYGRDNNIAANNFLETSLSELKETRKDPPICKRCRCHGIHLICETFVNYSPDNLPLIAASAPGALAALPQPDGRTVV
jgi:MoaA/NifB/PqqE/SkfB family radical SAM enzyme